MIRDYSPGPEFPTEGHGLLRHVLGLSPAGTALEFGVGGGASLAAIAEHMPVVGFDSFTGLPEDWRDGYPKGTFATSPPIIINSRLVIGLFEDTLPFFRFDTVAPIGLVHFDADLYSSTKTALKYVGPHLESGCYIVFDEWRGYPGADHHEQRAWREHVRATRCDWEVIGCSDQCWAIRLT